MPDASEVLRQGEQRPLFGSATLDGGTLTTSGTPTYTLYDSAGAVVTGHNAQAVTGNDAGPLETVRAWKTLDASLLVAGRYRLVFRLAVMGSDGIARLFLPAVDVTVVADGPAPEYSPAPLLLPTDFEAVRKAIDTSLTGTELPDSTVALPVYQARAEADVLQQDPQAATRTGDAAQRVRRAAILYCAARLCPAVPQVVQETFGRGDHGYRLREWDPLLRAAQLRAEADAELAAYLEADGQLAIPTLFSVVGGRRGW